MSKKRYITIQIIPDDSSEAWTIKLRYRFFEFLFYAVFIALFAIALAAVKITEINGKVLTANHLATMNRQLLDKQKKNDPAGTSAHANRRTRTQNSRHCGNVCHGV
jgi:hypothetical protein